MCIFNVMEQRMSDDKAEAKSIARIIISKMVFILLLKVDSMPQSINIHDIGFLFDAFFSITLFLFSSCIRNREKALHFIKWFVDNWFHLILMI